MAKGGDGRTEGRKDGKTDVWKFPPVFIGHRPFGEEIIRLLSFMEYCATRGQGESERRRLRKKPESRLRLDGFFANLLLSSLPF